MIYFSGAMPISVMSSAHIITVVEWILVILFV